MPPPTTNVSKPGPALAVFALLIVALGAAMWFGNARTPQLALDLSGGTTVTLTAVTQEGEEPDDANMQQAVEIIRSRVNGLGVSEAEVSQQGGNNIIVAVPGEGQERVVEQVGQTAELRFRQVLLYQPVGMEQPPASPEPSPTAEGDDAADDEAAESPSPSGTAEAPTQNRALSPALLADSGSSGGDGGATAAPGGATPQPQGTQPELPPELLNQLQQQQPDTSDIDEQVLEEFENLDCSEPETTRALKDADQQVAVCDREGTGKYVLSEAQLLGTMVTSAQAGLPQTGAAGGWLVQLEFDGEGTSRFGDLTRRVVNEQQPRNQVAIVLDGLVVSAPRINEPIPGGQAEITGDFTQQEAEGLANVLKYGALPLTFNQSDITSVSPTLGADQLRGGLIAAGIGMCLVVLYALFYYRALGFVAISSLALAAVTTYAAVSLLGAYMGYRLSIAGIAGLIVAIGITVDSFIVYFERLRDEAREGRSVRASVERGWRRARRTILVGDAVAFLAALVLWLLAVGGVKGFAFTLGLTTIIDVVIVFLFTKPAIAYLSRTKFFGDGHVLSGLDPRRMGVRAPSEVLTGRGRRPRSALGDA